MNIIPSLIIVVLFVALIVLDIITVRRWQKTWRILALLPGIAMLVVILNIVIGVWRDRTSHNLWPFEIILWSAGGLVFLGVLFVIKKIVKKVGGT